MKVTIILLLLAQVSWAGPFQQRGLFDFMLEDEASGIGPELPDDRDFEPPLGPVCPFRCQCHLRVVQCSDLEKFGLEIPRALHLEDKSPERLKLSGWAKGE
uniref:Decorin n=2 Tax=Rhinopithecus TaxID=542827 RepID=A0A2K6JZ28_RHIBE